MFKYYSYDRARKVFRPSFYLVLINNLRFFTCLFIMFLSFLTSFVKGKCYKMVLGVFDVLNTCFFLILHMFQLIFDINRTLR